jgi:hypothetical protein
METTESARREELQKDKEALMEQVEALRRENAELSDATKHTAGSNERARGEMEEKRIQIEQLQDEISRCKEAEATSAETGNRHEEAEDALQGRVILAEENLREAEQELQRVEEKCAQVMTLLEQAIWSPAKDIKWTTDGKSVLHAVKVMEMLGMGTIVVLIQVDDRRLAILQTEDGQPTNVIAETQRETKLDVCDHEEAAAKMKRTVSIMQTQWRTLTRMTEAWDLQVGEQVEVQFRSNLSESTRRVMGEVLQKTDIRDDELSL